MPRCCVPFRDRAAATGTRRPLARISSSVHSAPRKRGRVAELAHELEAPFQHLTEKSNLEFEKALLELTLLALEPIPFASTETQPDHAVRKVDSSLRWYTDHMAEEPTWNMWRKSFMSPRVTCGACSGKFATKVPSVRSRRCDSSARKSCCLTPMPNWIGLPKNAGFPVWLISVGCSKPTTRSVRGRGDGRSWGNTRAITDESIIVMKGSTRCIVVGNACSSGHVASLFFRHHPGDEDGE